MEVYEYTQEQFERMKTEEGVGFSVIDNKYYLPKDFVDENNIEKGIEKDIVIKSGK